jgi:cobalt-zinc-cadmium efflux system membrane fusion protein
MVTLCRRKKPLQQRTGGISNKEIKPMNVLCDSRFCIGGAIAIVVFVVLGGCRNESGQPDHGSDRPKRPQTAASALGPESSPVEIDLSKGWCGGHGVPESVCTRCNASLIPTFKEAGDWCAEHNLPESQCIACHPDVDAAWKKLNPEAAVEDQHGDASGAGAIPTLKDNDPRFAGKWCMEHGVPESVCTRCNSDLIAGFKEVNDWCGEHGLPESQCTICNPEAREKWAAIRPATSTSVDDELKAILLERSPRLLTGTSDPLCQVDALRVSFLDPSIVRKAGIRVERVGRRSMSATIQVPAEVEFDATRSTRVTPLVGGVIREVPVELGSNVNVGDRLAVIDSPALGEAKSEYIARAQNHKLAKSDIERVNTIYQGAQRMLEVCTPEAQSEKIRDALADSPVGNAKAMLLRAHAALQLARSQAARAATLQAKKLNSERDYQVAQSALAAAEADFIATREEVRFSVDQARLTAERGIEVARAALESAVRRLHILGLNMDQIGMIGSEGHEALSRFELRSPASGRLIDLRASVGESVDDADVLFVIVDTSDMWLMANVHERDLRLLRLGLPAHFSVDGMPGAGFEGKVAWISSQVDERTRTVRLRAHLPNPDGLLRAKMFGQARIVIHANDEVVGVPVDAVQTDGCCQLVFVEESETVFQPRKVALGARANGFVEVLRGLEEGEAVATIGSFLMKTEILKGNIGAGCCEVEPGR